MLHLRRIYDTPRRELQADTHRRLRNEMEEQRISKQMIEDYNRNLIREPRRGERKWWLDT